MITDDVIVYRARNTVNGNCYIGVTRRGLIRREHEHRYEAKRGGKTRLHKALRKWGDKILFETIMDFEGDYELAMVFEAEIVEKERPAYNLVPGGLNRTGPAAPETTRRLRESHLGKPSPRKGTKLPPETVAKLRGQKRTDEQRARMSAAQKNRLAGKPGFMTGKKHTEEARAKMRAARAANPIGYWAGKKRPDAAEWLRKANTGRPSPMRGVPKPREQVEKMRAAKIGKPKTMTPAAVKAQAENYAKMLASKYRAVVCLNDGRVFKRVSDVPAEYGVSLSSVIRVLKRRSLTVKGWRFAYVGGGDLGQ